ncbi:MAG: tetratricopeptide repeat protein, partial [Acidobacteriota bacterium]
MSTPTKKRTTDRKNQVRSENQTIWIVLLLAVVSFLLYFNTIGHGFVFDDITLILQNPQVLNFDISGIFSLQGYRPVRTLTHAVEWALVGDNPMLFHVNNILLHVFNVLLLFFFLKKLTRSRAASLAGSIFFMVHPVQTAAVAYISGRKDLLATAFLLLGFWFYLKVADSAEGGKWRQPAAWTFFVLALLSKEVAIVFPAMMLGIDMVTGRSVNLERPAGRSFPGALGDALRSRPYQYAAFTVLAVLALVWAVVINQASRAEGYWGGSLLTNLGTGLKLFAHYLKLVFVPHPLIADYTGEVFPVSGSITELATVVSVLLVIIYLAFAFWIFRKSPLVSLGMLWFAAALSPVLHFIPFHELAADHFMYFPLVGAAVCISGVVLLLKKSASACWKKNLIVLMVILAVSAGVMTVHRNRAWKDQETLWETTLAQAPESYRANVNLGQMALAEQRISEGIDYTERAIELDPSKAVPRNNLGALYYTLGQQASMSRDFGRGKDLLYKSIEQCKAALELDPSRIFTAVNYGSAYKELANIADAEGDSSLADEYRIEAENFYMRALNAGDERKELKSAWLNLGLMYIDAGRFNEAIPHIDRYIQAYSDNNEVWRGYYWKGYSQYSLGRFQSAAETFEKAAAVHGDMDVFNSLV